MTFNENDLYTIAIALVKETGFKPDFELKVVNLLTAIQDQDVNQIDIIVKNMDEETKEDVSGAVSLAVIKAQSTIEKEIIASGDIAQIEVLNAIKEKQLEMINSFKA